MRESPCPFDLGYRMPAEREPHKATWLAWPHNEETWPGRLPHVEEIYLEMIQALAPHEKVHLLVNDPPMEERVRKRLGQKGVEIQNVSCHILPTVDAWIRDYGPSFILRRAGGEGKKGKACVRWIFNAWGRKYVSEAQDDRVTDQLGPILQMPVFKSQMVLEGGAIDTNGKGTCLATEECLLNPNRNPGLSRVEIERTLRDYLGLTHLIWLGEGIEGDDTDGHVDNLARFVEPATVVAAEEKNSRDPNKAVLEKNLKRLRQATDQDGKKLTVATLPMPDRLEGPRGRLPVSYLNFYVANGVVLAPIFGHRNDSAAMRVLEELFPTRQIIGIRSETLVLGLGGIHCVTHEEPEEP